MDVDNNYKSDEIPHPLPRNVAQTGFSRGRSPPPRSRRQIVPGFAYSPPLSRHYSFSPLGGRRKKGLTSPILLSQKQVLKKPGFYFVPDICMYLMAVCLKTKIYVTVPGYNIYFI
jgi:hypothetical protein